MCIHILLRNICIQLHTCKADWETLQPDLETFCQNAIRRELYAFWPQLLALLGLKCSKLMLLDHKLREIGGFRYIFDVSITNLLNSPDCCWNWMFCSNKPKVYWSCWRLAGSQYGYPLDIQPISFDAQWIPSELPSLWIPKESWKETFQPLVGGGEKKSFNLRLKLEIPFISTFGWEAEIWLILFPFTFGEAGNPFMRGTTGGPFRGLQEFR